MAFETVAVRLSNHILDFQPLQRHCHEHALRTAGLTQEELDRLTEEADDKGEPLRYTLYYEALTSETRKLLGYVIDHLTIGDL